MKQFVVTPLTDHARKEFIAWADGQALSVAWVDENTIAEVKCVTEMVEPLRDFCDQHAILCAWI